MKKQCLVVGLGIYGMSVARKLSEEGIDVLAIDKNMKLVEKASEFVTKAICMDITSLESLDELPLSDFDVAVVGIGENISVSLLTCLTLKDANIPKIIAKAGDRMHRKVLEKINVDEIVLPEEELGYVTERKIINDK